GIRVPMVARWPAKIKPSTRSAHISAFWDVLPTLAEVAGASVPEGIDGISFLPTLSAKEQRAHAHLYWEFHEQQGKQAVRKGDWKAIKLNVSEPDPTYLLYNLAEDPAESHDLSAEHPEILQEMLQIMDAEHVEDPEWPFLDR